APSRSQIGGFGAFHIDLRIGAWRNNRRRNALSGAARALKRSDSAWHKHWKEAALAFSKEPLMSLVLDAGALVAVERADRNTIALLKEELLARRIPLT